VDDPEGLGKLREREKRGERERGREGREGDGLGGVSRYSMAAKRIW
jgi:hypothetical protein